MEAFPLDLSQIEYIYVTVFCNLRLYLHMHKCFPDIIDLKTGIEP
jgi:hypothetical protein